MALAKKPSKITPIKLTKSAKAAKFAEGPAPAAEPGDSEPAQVIIRLDRKLLARIDATGKALGFSQRAPFMLTTLVDRVRRFESEGN